MFGRAMAKFAIGAVREKPSDDMAVKKLQVFSLPAILAKSEGRFLSSRFVLGFESLPRVADRAADPLQLV